MDEKICISDSQVYTIPLESIELSYLNKYIRNPKDEKVPLWTKTRLDGEAEYYHLEIVKNNNLDEHECFSETCDTYNCNICNIDVPKPCYEKHIKSEKHQTLKNIYEKVLERVSKQLNATNINDSEDITGDLYYCVPCSKLIKVENRIKHENTAYHRNSQQNFNIIHDFYNIINADNKLHIKNVEKHENSNEEIDKKCTVSTQMNISNDKKSLSLKITSANYDEKPAVSKKKNNDKTIVSKETTIYNGDLINAYSDKCTVPKEIIKKNDKPPSISINSTIINDYESIVPKKPKKRRKRNKKSNVSQNIHIINDNESKVAKPIIENDKETTVSDNIGKSIVAKPITNFNNKIITIPNEITGAKSDKSSMDKDDKVTVSNKININNEEKPSLSKKIAKKNDKKPKVSTNMPIVSDNESTVSKTVTLNNDKENTVSKKIIMNNDAISSGSKNVGKSIVAIPVTKINDETITFSNEIIGTTDDKSTINDGDKPIISKKVTINNAIKPTVSKKITIDNDEKPSVSKKNCKKKQKASTDSKKTNKKKDIKVTVSKIISKKKDKKSTVSKKLNIINDNESIVSKKITKKKDKHLTVPKKKNKNLTLPKKVCKKMPKKCCIFKKITVRNIHPKVSKTITMDNNDEFTVLNKTTKENDDTSSTSKKLTVNEVESTVSKEITDKITVSKKITKKNDDKCTVQSGSANNANEDQIFKESLIQIIKKNLNETENEQPLDFYIRKMKATYNLTGEELTADRNSIYLNGRNGSKLQVNWDHFHSYIIDEKTVFCQICNLSTDCDKRFHDERKSHVEKVFNPIDDNYCRMVDDYFSHCLLCNIVILTTSKHHIYSEKHKEMLLKATLAQESPTTETQPNEKMFCETCNVNIVNSNLAKHMKKKKHIKIENSIMDMNKIRKINNEQYLCELCDITFTRDGLNLHCASDSHKEELNNTEVTKANGAQYCPICTVFVPKGGMPVHIAGKTHLSKLKNTKKHNLNRFAMQNVGAESDIYGKAAKINNNNDLLTNNNIKTGDSEDTTSNINIDTANMAHTDKIIDTGNMTDAENATAEANMTDAENATGTANMTDADNIINNSYIITNIDDPEIFAERISNLDRLKMRIKCEICDVILQGEDEVIKHRETEPHEIRKVYDYTVRLRMLTSPNTVQCSICRCRIPDTVTNVIQHVEGRVHKDKEKRHVLISNTKRLLRIGVPVRIVCTDCNITLPNIQKDMQDHVLSQSHRENENARKIKVYKELLHETKEFNIMSCELCDSTIYYTDENLLEHFNGLHHQTILVLILIFHKITKMNDGQYYCKCCHQNITDTYAHVNSKYHTEKFQLKVFLDTELIKSLVYETLGDSIDDYIMNNEAILYRKLYSNILFHNKITQIDDSQFYCSVCDVYLKPTSEIDHVFGENHCPRIKMSKLGKK